jgi:hypothetical protein
MEVSDNDLIGQQFRKKAIELSSNVISRHTIPLLTRVEKNGSVEYVSIGSGIFVKKEKDFFVLTAAHVVSAHLLIYFQTASSGLLQYEPVQIAYIIDNTLDAAVIVLSRPLGELLTFSYEILPFTYLLFNHLPIEYNHYAVVGYPANYISRKGIIIHYKSVAYLVRSASDKVYNYHSLNKNSFYVLRMDGKVVDDEGNSVKPRQLHGISGCGLWFISYKIIRNEMRLYYHLIGIVTQQIKAKFYVLAATNVKFATYPIDKYIKDGTLESI